MVTDKSDTPTMRVSIKRKTKLRDLNVGMKSRKWLTALELAEARTMVSEKWISTFEELISAILELQDTHRVFGEGVHIGDDGPSDDERDDEATYVFEDAQEFPEQPDTMI